MKQRIITGAILALVMLCVFFLSGTWLYVAIMTLLSAIGVWEMLGCVGQRGEKSLSALALCAAVISPILSYFFRYGVITTIITFTLFFMLVVSVFTQNRIRTEQCAVVFATSFYVIICFSALLRLRYVTFGEQVVGQYVYILVFVAAWITDTFAYFTGVFFGKHKLIPKISPKKTVEGALGGIVFCVIAFLIYGFVVENVSEYKANFVGLAFVGLVMSVISQIGDLLASAIKRNYDVKDYGRLFPGHGGVLDRFDSVMALAPFLLVLCEDAQFLNLLLY